MALRGRVRMEEDSDQQVVRDSPAAPKGSDMDKLK